jgi:hypothetical protein
MPELTYEGPQPTGGGASYVVIEDKDGEVFTLHQGVPTEVSADAAKVAQDLNGHKFKSASTKTKEKESE